jgi:hypothetical protein
VFLESPRNKEEKRNKVKLKIVVLWYIGIE